MALEIDAVVGVEPDRRATPYKTALNSCVTDRSRATISPMLEYELYVPLHYNDGRRIDPAKLKALKKRLVDQFGGLTHFQQDHEGLWKIGDHTFRDRIEILQLLVTLRRNLRTDVGSRRCLR